MTAPLGPVNGFSQGRLLTDHIATHANLHQSTGHVPEQPPGETERPLDKVELTSDYINDIQHLRAAGPGVPLFRSVDEPDPAAAGKGSEPPGSTPSDKTLLVDAFG